jgi:hypothetical protein
MEKTAQAAQFLESLPFINEIPEKEEPKHIIEEVEEPKAAPKEYIFKLDVIPGAEIQEDEPEIEEDKENVAQEIKEEQPVDEFDWRSRGLCHFLDWLQERFETIPKHSGRDTTGVERALAYFERLNIEISKAMKQDYKREIDAAKAEEARSQILKGIELLNKRLKGLLQKKFKKSAALGNKLVKTAETSTTGNIVVTVDYLISHIARTCIEATVQAGRDIEDVFDKLSKEYSLNKREKAQVKQLLRDMGYAYLVDRVNPGKDYQPGSNEVSEYITQYYA